MWPKCRLLLSGGYKALLETADTKILGILSVKCTTIEVSIHTQQINEQETEEKSCINKNSNANQMASSKMNTKFNILFSRPEKEAHMKTSSVVTQSVHYYFKCFTRIGSLKQNVC